MLNEGWDGLGRPAAINEDDSGQAGNALASYSYSGPGRLAIEQFRLSANLDLKLDYHQGGADYAGFDRFGRVKDQKWVDTQQNPATLDRYTYGHDRNSNRKYRENGLTAGKSELYTYDNLNRLTSYDRGDLNQDKTAITNKVRNEAWTLTAVGNWSAYRIDANGDGDYADQGDLDQLRTHNPDGIEITGITGVTDRGGPAAALAAAGQPVPAGGGRVIAGPQARPAPGRGYTIDPPIPGWAGPWWLPPRRAGFAS